MPWMPSRSRPRPVAYMRGAWRCCPKQSPTTSSSKETSSSNSDSTRLICMGRRIPLPSWFLTTSPSTKVSTRKPSGRQRRCCRTTCTLCPTFSGVVTQRCASSARLSLWTSRTKATRVWSVSCGARMALWRQWWPSTWSVPMEANRASARSWVLASRARRRKSTFSLSTQVWTTTRETRRPWMSSLPGVTTQWLPVLPSRCRWLTAGIWSHAIWMRSSRRCGRPVRRTRMGGQSCASLTQRTW
mmetsp:Transcript_27119/g.63191  ORF Transcript_27119/g.63191 Transcript_27119/m.63191 type:complete len:243 (+) Transcript_27119:142-870(+)